MIARIFRQMSCLAGLLLMAGNAFGQSVKSGEMFDPAAAAGDIKIGYEACLALERQNSGIMVRIDGTGYCIRYYAAGLRTDDKNPIAAVWLHGDIMGPHERPATKHLAGVGVNQIIDQEAALFARFKVPYIFIARPGSYGSAGRHHHMRHTTLEARIVSATLDALKRKYHIERLALGGHSGGGMLVAEFLNHRKDLACAVISSAPAGGRGFTRQNKRAGDPQIIDPISKTSALKPDPARRIFVLADPRDTNVRFALQQPYVDALKKAGQDVTFLPLEKAPPPEYHDLMDAAETATGLCAAGKPTSEIVDTLKALPQQAPRQIN
ncbi:alpha/beta hydrolase [Oryzifoliimicrobium ureilyticus]|uniref:alpha/beta hydrolase n=1 Tax=Oryzifoliimicrobium ureilyticus TaxID=3113724 RepID=UPI0030762316